MKNYKAQVEELFEKATNELKNNNLFEMNIQIENRTFGIQIKKSEVTLLDDNSYEVDMSEGEIEYKEIRRDTFAFEHKIYINDKKAYSSTSYGENPFIYESEKNSYRYMINENY